MGKTTYPVECPCGAVLQVSGSAAGTSVACHCGRTVEVPTLARLKSIAGESVLSPDFEIQQLLAAKAMPLVPDCAVCDRPTDRTAQVSVVCERPEEVGRVPLWQQLLLAWVSIWLFVLHMMTARTQTHGRDVAFLFPVRVCERRDRDFAGKSVRDALIRTPVFARLFQKYPHAKVTRTD